MTGYYRLFFFIPCVISRQSSLTGISCYIWTNENENKNWLCLDLTTRQPLWVILCRLPEKERKEIEEIVEEMKERNREERLTGMKEKKQKK